MEREFVSYEQAVALQELGCGVIMNYKYWRVEKNILVFYSDYNMQSIIDKGFDVECLNVSAPLKQQVFRWFREKYNLSPIIWSAKINQVFYGYDIIHIKKQKLVINNTELGGGDCDYSIYEEAENACIDKLLELAKQS